MPFRNEIESDAGSSHEWPHGFYNLHTHVSGWGAGCIGWQNRTCGSRPFTETEEAHVEILKSALSILVVCFFVGCLSETHWKIGGDSER